MNTGPIIDLINDILNVKCIKTETKILVKNFFNSIVDGADVNEIKHINEMVRIMSKSKIVAADKVSINDMAAHLIDIINKYRAASAPAPVITEEVEYLLDSTIPKYNKYSLAHPMQGTTFDAKTRRYRIFYDKTPSTVATIKDARRIIIERIVHDKYSKVKQLEHIEKVVLSNEDCQIIKYVSGDIEYFDIQHVIGLFDFKSGSKASKYSSFKNRIDGYFVTKNEFGGYIVRELIVLSTAKIIIGSSQGLASAKVARVLGIDVLDHMILRKEDTCCGSIRVAFKKDEINFQKSIGKYRIDAFFPKYNLAIECDEHNHKDRSEQYEKKRQTFIESEGIKFIRFDPDAKDFKILDVISRIHYCIMKIEMHNAKQKYELNFL